MDPMFDLVRDRTQDLRRTAEAARRERELRGSSLDAQDRHSNAAVASEVAVMGGAGPCVPAETARAA